MWNIPNYIYVCLCVCETVTVSYYGVTCYSPSNSQYNWSFHLLKCALSQPLNGHGSCCCSFGIPTHVMKSCPQLCCTQLQTWPAACQYNWCCKQLIELFSFDVSGEMLLSYLANNVLTTIIQSEEMNSSYTYYKMSGSACLIDYNHK